MPKKYTPLSTYKSRAEEYFRKCDEANSTDKTKIVKPYTLSGLLCALGITKEQFFSLSKRRDGRELVNYLVLKIEAFIEENALSGKLSANAAVNSLKHSLGWNDKSEEADSESITVTLCDDIKRLGE